MTLLLMLALNPMSQWRMDSATPAGGAPAAAAPPSAVPSASPAATVPAASSAVPPVPGTSPTPATPGVPEDGNWKAMRDRLTAAEQKTALLGTLDDFNEADLPAAWKQYRTMTTEIATLGRELNYTPEEIKAAMEADPVFALSVLRAEKDKAAPPPPPKPGESQVDYDKRIADEVAKQTKPYTEHINRQISDAVEAKIHTEFTRVYDSVLPNTPPEVRGLVNDYVEEYLASPAAKNQIIAMKARGDYSAVETVVTTVAARLKDVFTKWTAHETSRTGRGTPSTPGAHSPTAPNANGRFTLDQIINDPGVLGPQYK